MNNLHDWLISLKNDKKLIIVEGKKDKNVLYNLGIDNIITLSKPLFEIVELVSNSTNECIILSDLDAEGRKIYSYLKRHLERNGVKVDLKYRNFLFKNTNIRNIEGLKRHL